MNASIDLESLGKLIASQIAAAMKPIGEQIGKLAAAQAQAAGATPGAAPAVAITADDVARIVADQLKAQLAAQAPATPQAPAAPATPDAAAPPDAATLARMSPMALIDLGLKQSAADVEARAAKTAAEMPDKVEMPWEKMERIAAAAKAEDAQRQREFDRLKSYNGGNPQLLIAQGLRESARRP